MPMMPHFLLVKRSNMNIVRILIYAALVCLLSSCGELPADREKIELTVGTDAVSLQSTGGCALDNDCEHEKHCFQSLCVEGCTQDDDCESGATCTTRGRCVNHKPGLDQDVHVVDAVDRSREAIVPESLPATQIINVSPDRIYIPKQGDEVMVTLEVDQELPKAGLSYVLAFHHDGTRSPVRVAHGKTTVDIPIPLAGNIPDAGKTIGVDIVTAAGSVMVQLIQPLPIDGLYAGSTRTETFGGARLPIELLLQTVPSNVTSLDEASSVFIHIPMAANRVFGLPSGSKANAWAKSPLQWDDLTHAWVGTLSAPVDVQRVFGAPLYPEARRSIRVELQATDEVGVFDGAWTDRWSNITDRVSSDGVVQPMDVSTSGRFTVARSGNRPAMDLVDVDASGPPWTQLPRALPAHCTDSDLQAIAGPEENERSACQTIARVEALEGSDPAFITQCAFEYADAHHAESMLADQLFAFLDPDRDNPYGMSFTEFLDACAKRTNGICVASRPTKCARELAAYAYSSADAANGDAQKLAHQYNELTQDIFLGAKLAAFQSDTSARLEWLRSSEAPLFLASALKDYNLNLLRDWQTKVLDTLMDSVFGQLDDAGLMFLSRSTNEASVIAMRQTMLLDLGVLWQSAADSLSVYAKRLNLLEEDDTRRNGRAEKLYQQFFRLYIAGSVIAEFGREAGTSAQNIQIGNYLAALEKDIAALARPFNDLILARSTEVVTSLSVDQTSDSRSLIQERHDDAMRAIESAQQSVDVVQQEAKLNEMTEATLRTRYEDQLLDLRNELISLCGLKSGCDANDVGTAPACDVPTDIGACGLESFLGEYGFFESGKTVASEAGIVLYDLWKAIDAAGMVQKKEQDALARLTLKIETADSLAKTIKTTMAKRDVANAQVTQISKEISQLNATLLQEKIGTIHKQQAIREQAYVQQKQAVSNWSKITRDGVQSDMKLLNKANTASMNAEILSYSADRAKAAGDVAATAVPEISANPFQMIVNVIKAVVQTGIKAIGFAASTAMGSVATNQRIQANSMEMQMEIGGLQGDQYTAEMKDLEALGAKRSHIDIEAIEADMDSFNLSNQQEIDALKSLIDSLDKGLQLDEQVDRELMALRDRRDEILKDATMLEGYNYEFAQANLTIQHQNLAYQDLVQRAKVLEARFNSAQQRWSNIENIMGSPDVIFSFANRLALAESRLDTARTALQEWLIALEYYAVRPFVSQRIAILLARNPQQLEAIAHELERLQGACGGSITNERVEVSLRDNLLGLNIPTLLQEGQDGASDVVASPAERFRALLRRANTPVNKRARLNAKQTIGQRLADGNVLAANFTLSVDDFANLPQTCNGKVSSIAAQLVGLENTDAQPVITIVYDGSSELRSCQANIRELVLAVGPEATSFGPVTRFRTGSRAISPVVGFSDYGAAKTWNATLEGTPLAAGYTVMIDKDLAANQDIPWEDLEDIRLQFAYSYQDVFPDGQCE